MLERTNIRNRLDCVKMILRDDPSYCRALQIHHQSAGIVAHLSQLTGRRAPRDGEMIVTLLTLLYGIETRAAGIEASAGCAISGVSAHFLHFAAGRLPEEPRVSSLRALMWEALGIWRMRNPGVVAEPVWALTRPAGQTV